ncbi:hypothetical protein DESC_500155 [Desulfosarcina cetonica]|uniref:hypothetical protein n=1 Tax=Desulfosarcina cetonica TaxID=90730 RepID=UPI0006D0C8A2|nr:hypothetical protein [Desulfosarcina cetonica]VTR66771.1 hypothetical protein DESC_500155 [Desulfosarcina cetonica]
MQAETNIPDTIEAVTAEVVSILAQGYMRYRKGRRLPSDSQDSEGNVVQVQESEAFTEKRLDVSGHRSLHSFTS